jgi:hypothetical protein
MFELHVVVAGIVMFNIMELIMEIVPNYPTGSASQRFNYRNGKILQSRIGGASSRTALTLNRKAMSSLTLLVLSEIWSERNARVFTLVEKRALVPVRKGL